MRPLEDGQQGEDMTPSRTSQRQTGRQQPGRVSRRTALAAIAAFAARPAHAQPARWVIPSEYPESSMPGEGLRTFAALVASRAGGGLLALPSFDNESRLRSSDMPGAVRDQRFPAADAF